MNTTPHVTVMQDGSRRRYQIPLAFDQNRHLLTCFTDWYAAPGSTAYRFASFLQKIGIRAATPLLNRYNTQLDPNRVASNRWLALTSRFHQRKISDATTYYHWHAKQMTQWAIKHWPKQTRVLYGYIRNIHPDLLRFAQNRGIYTIGDQIIAPAKIEKLWLERQHERWPDWEEKHELEHLDRVHEFEQESWQACDAITAMSAFTQNGLLEQHVEHERIVPIPYPFDLADWPTPTRPHHTGPLTIGFVGSANLRKGIPLIIDIARQAPQHRFVIIGHCELNPQRINERPDNVEMLGRRTRDQVRDNLAKMDAFIFPSVCEGAAGAVIEAMASELCVLTTPNAGSPIEHNKSGFLLPTDDPQPYLETLEQLASDPNLRHNIGRQARQQLLNNNTPNKLAQALASACQRATQTVQ